MNVVPPLPVIAVVEMTPPLYVGLASVDEVRRVGDRMGCRVRILDAVYEPTGARATLAAKNGSANGTAVPLSPRELRDQVLLRANAQPARTFKVADFLDLGSKKDVAAALHYLWKRKKINRPRRGEYQSKRSGPATKSTALERGATGNGPVLAFMKEHAGEWLNAAAVTKGMGLPDDRKGAIAAALARLAPRYLQKRKGGYFCYQPSAEVAAR